MRIDASSFLVLFLVCLACGDTGGQGGAGGIATIGTSATATSTATSLEGPLINKPVLFRRDHRETGGLVSVLLSLQK